jgi:hypothetical protein
MLPMNTTSTWSQGHNWLYTIDCYCRNILVLWENFEDTKGVLRSRKSEDRQYNDQKKEAVSRRVLRLTASFFWPLYCLSSDLRLLSSGHCIVCPPTYGFFLLVIVLSVLRLTASFFWSLYCLSCDLLLLSSGHCIVCPPTYGFFLLAIVLSVLRLTASFFWPLYCLSSDLRLLSSGHCIVCPPTYGFFLLVIEERSRKSEDRQYNGQKKEAVSRRTDNTMARRKRTNGQTAIYETLHKKLKIEQKRTPLKNGREQGHSS